MAIVTVGNIEVVVRTRGEHCPPHVHADCSPEGWSARYQFGYLTDEVSFWDFHQPDHPRRPPNMATIDAVGDAIYDNLVAIRERWWQVMGTVCLDNQPVRVIGPNQFSLVSGFRLPRIQQATYSPATQTLTVMLSDGTKHNQSLLGR